MRGIGLRASHRSEHATDVPVMELDVGAHLDAAALKLLRLAARNISDKRGGDLGTGTWGWKHALNQFEIHFPGRLGLT